MTSGSHALWQALRENYAEPEGPARNARAERIFAEIEQSGETGLLIDGLNHLMQVYNYSSETDKMFVPFARLLRLWEERPGEFDSRRAHSLFWMFKWVSSGMIDQPHIPLASIERWQDEMARRYRLAGHSERAVRQGELRIARHIGDMERAARAYAAWQAAERDDKSDCRACELHTQGAWLARRGDDAGALESWRPVLTGELTCAHEPHEVLAASLLPLLRLGRAGDARAHHLRGYRLVRPMESMRGAVARHVEFCALTGNEARGLEILAERPAYFTDTGEPGSLLDHLAVTALLTGRLTALGHGEHAVTGPPDRSWTVRELAGHARAEALALAGRFDLRNGTTAVSDRIRERMDRAPLLERLPLGLSAGRPATAAAVTPAPAPPAGAAVGELIAAARELSEAQRPGALAAWAAVSAAAGREGTDLDPLVRAEIAEHRAMEQRVDSAEAARLFDTAAGLHESAGDPGRALAARARAAYARIDDGSGPGVEEAAAADSARSEILVLLAEGRARPREAARVLLSRCRIRQAGVVAAAGEPEAAMAALEEAAAELTARMEPHLADGAVGAAVAEALGLLGNISAFRGRDGEAAELYARAAAGYEAAGRPWFSVEVHSQLAAVRGRLGDPAAAVRAARAALEHARAHTGAGGLCGLHLQLMEYLAETGEHAEAAEHALQASHWADEAGGNTAHGGYARHRLGGLLLAQGRADEAATVLETVLPELTADEHGEGMIVQTLWWLGDCLTALDSPRTAAEHWLRAADIARGWPDQRDHAMLANLAGEALYRAELNPEAESAFRRAGELWRGLGDGPALVRTLRVRAWLALREGREGPAAARELMRAAEEEAERALRAGAPSGEALGRLRAELADTHRQTGELIANTVEGRPDPGDTDGPVRAAYDEALAYTERAVAGFTALGPAGARDRARAELLAGWLAADLADPAGAEARARGVLAGFASDEALRTEAEALLRYARG
ncbi:tetratricopeptide repeat protein [Streptomyces sp. CAU 1734]|uniref:tetratricopeptide repeat protein n=1 Tax=Streptomyces sp. CAU 1734 TaxID=3140360 RepID=UPI0032609C24